MQKGEEGYVADLLQPLILFYLFLFTSRSNLEQEPPKVPIRYYEIDLLRFLAALSVVLYHWTYRGYTNSYFMPQQFPVLAPVTKYGWLGVQLFFLISGYVVLMSAAAKTVKQFFLSRVTRLYPAYWVAATITFVFMRVFGPHVGESYWSSTLDVPLREYVVNLTMLQEFVGVENVDSSYWSLTIELGFYFLLSLVMGYRLFGHLPFLLTLWLVFTAVSGPDPVPKTAFFTLFFPKHAPYFIGGMVFYLLQNKWFPRWQLYSLLAFAFALSLRSVRLDVVLFRQLFQDASFRFSVAAVMITCFYGIFLLLIHNRLTLHHRWLKILGGLTYPLYLLHSHIGWVIFHRLASWNKYGVLAGLLLAMLLLAYLIHEYVEKPLGKPLPKRLDDVLTGLAWQQVNPK